MKSSHFMAISGRNVKNTGIMSPEVMAKGEKDGWLKAYTVRCI